MRILIATPTYPPDHGGPSYYAQSLNREFEMLGHVVAVRHYTFERRFPSWLKHFLYFLKTMPAYARADLVILLDPMIVGFPIAMLKVLFGGIVILRTGGDFLWEGYVERTKEKVLLSDFYAKPRQLSAKEKIIFLLTKFVLRVVTNVVFSTHYQRDIWTSAYGIPAAKVAIIENRYEPAAPAKNVWANSGELAHTKVFVYAAARRLIWKNADIAEAAFGLARKHAPGITLEFLLDVPRDEALAKIKNAYAVILTSLGDISPNYVLRALSFGVPVILTTENGLRDRIGDAAMYVDPLDAHAIARAVVAMSDPTTYAEYRRRVATLSFTHTYEDIAKEFLQLCPRH